MSTYIDILKKLRLENDAITVYKLLLSDGALSVTDISKRATLHRPKTYAVLKDLREAELIVPVVRGKRTFYEAASPRRLRYMVGLLAEEVESVIPELEQLAKGSSARSSTHIEQLNGREGLAYAFMDVVDSLARHDIFYRIGSERNQKIVDGYVPREYRILRDKKHLERLVITSNAVAMGKKPRMERVIRLITEGDELFDQNVIEFIYGDKISLLDFNTEQAVIIENQAMAQFQKKLFLTLYKHLPATPLL